MTVIFRGRPDLRAETGETGRCRCGFGTRWALGTDGPDYSSEASWFAHRTRNTIAVIPGSGLVAQAQNLGEARAFGFECTSGVRLGQAVQLSYNYTFLDARQRSDVPSYDGKRLPQRPRHQLYWRVEVAGTPWRRLWTAWTDVTLSSGSPLDAANIRDVPGKALSRRGGAPRAGGRMARTVRGQESC